MQILTLRLAIYCVACSTVRFQIVSYKFECVTHDFCVHSSSNSGVPQVPWQMCPDWSHVPLGVQQQQGVSWTHGESGDALGTGGRLQSGTGWRGRCLWNLERLTNLTSFVCLCLFYLFIFFLFFLFFYLISIWFKNNNFQKFREKS